MFIFQFQPDSRWGGNRGGPGHYRGVRSPAAEKLLCKAAPHKPVDCFPAACWDTRDTTRSCHTLTG